MYCSTNLDHEFNRALLTEYEFGQKLIIFPWLFYSINLSLRLTIYSSVILGFVSVSIIYFGCLFKAANPDETLSITQFYPKKGRIPLVKFIVPIKFVFRVLIDASKVGTYLLSSDISQIPALLTTTSNLT